MNKSDKIFIAGTSTKSKKIRGMKMLTEKKHKEMIKASIMELMIENKEFFKEIYRYFP